MLRTEMTNVLRDLFAVQKSELNAMIVQHLRQQQAATPKPPVINTANTSRTTTPLPAATPSTVPMQMVSSATVTPTVDPKQQHVLKLARAGQYNQAFEYALSAADLNLVLYLCEHISPNELFNLQPFPLQTPVLLSLIQQLSANLNNQQELKFR